MDAVGRNDITEGKVIVTEKLGKVVKQHQQHSKGTLQEEKGEREGEGGRGGGRKVQYQAVKGYMIYASTKS